MPSTTQKTAVLNQSVELPGNYIAKVLSGLHAPLTPPNIAILAALGGEEHGGVSSNPTGATGGHNQGGAFNLIDTTLAAPGSISYNSVGVQSYASAASGEAANISTLSEKQFAPLTSALQSGTASFSQLVADANATPLLGYNADGTTKPFLGAPSSVIQNTLGGTSGPLVAAVDAVAANPLTKVFPSSANVNPASVSAQTDQQSAAGTDAGGAVSGVGPLTGQNGLLTGALSSLEGGFAKVAGVLIGAIFVLVGLVVIAHGAGKDVSDSVPQPVRAAGTKAAEAAAVA